PGKLRIQTELAQFSEEKIALVRSGWDRPRFGHIPGRRIKQKLSVPLDNAGPESDRRNVTFAGCTQAQDDADGALGKVGLIRMRDNAWIEERRALERILAYEVGANEQLALLGQCPVAWQVALHLFETLHEDFANPLMPAPKFAEDLVQNRQNLFLRQRKDSRENRQRTRCVVRIDRLRSCHRRQKGTHKHSRGIRTQGQRK